MVSLEIPKFRDLGHGFSANFLQGIKYVSERLSLVFKSAFALLSSLVRSALWLWSRLNCFVDKMISCMYSYINQSLSLFKK